MGNPKQKWTTEEEEALKAGVAKHGAGKWKNIQRDPEFNPYLCSRTNIDLKDKWRNMTVNAGEKSRPLKPKASSPTVSAAPAPAAVSSGLVVHAQALPASASAPVLGDMKVEDSKSAVDMTNAPRYNNNGMIFEAISALNESNGADVPGIIDYIQQRRQLPPNFRKQLVAKLRKLVGQQKLEKVQNVYKIIKIGSSLETKTPALEEKGIKPRYIPSVCPKSPRNPLEDATDAAASKAAEAENKSVVAVEAIKEAGRVSRMAEEAESLLQLAREILEKCLRDEELLLRV